jgi:peptide/nickel transport system permease protein
MALTTIKSPGPILPLKMRQEQRGLVFRRISRSRLLVSGGSIFLLIVLAAVLIPVFVKLDPYAVDPVNRLQAPDGAHTLGTDAFGRDLLARVVQGSRASLLIGFLVAVLTATIGLVVGLYAAFYPKLGAVLMRIADGMMAFPGILLAIAIMAALGPQTSNVILALTVGYTPQVARVMRSSALVVKNQTYVEALVALGAGPTRILWRNVVPNVLSPLLVQTTFIFANVLLAEATLSFLGIGVPAPEPSWGNILFEGKTVIYNSWWLTVFPGMAILLTVLSVNMLGDGLRDLLDPRQARKR